MREHRQEAILLPVGLLQRGGSLFQFRSALLQCSRGAVPFLLSVPRVLLCGRGHAAVNDVQDDFARFLAVCGGGIGAELLDDIHQHMAEQGQFSEDVWNRVPERATRMAVRLALGLHLGRRARAQCVSELVDQRR